MNYIVMSSYDYNNNQTTILTHEKAHIDYKHSIELLLVDIMAAFQWFNLAIWMLRSDLQDLHEYEADDAVLKSGTNIKGMFIFCIKSCISFSCIESCSCKNSNRE